MYIHRQLENVLKEVLNQFSGVLITGARQAGKSTMLKETLKGYNYVSFDDVLVRKLAVL